MEIFDERGSECRERNSQLSTRNVPKISVNLDVTKKLVDIHDRTQNFRLVTPASEIKMKTPSLYPEGLSFLCNFLFH